ncbi:MAG: UDP-3-O-(3-hydroxymyristoyl)glucosamine N-acyltransferase [Proteobacteria bacterium]|nr:UDP-3-O-(3-hydroxymyristoyl)glucosamine N-acyltransferase [Pseudomonadota bacterium]
MVFSVSEIANALGAEFSGEGNIQITSASEPSVAKRNSLAIAMSEKYFSELEFGQAEAALLTTGMDWKNAGLKAAIFVDRSRHALSRLTKFFSKDPDILLGIHETAFVHPTAVIGPDVAIGPFVFIGRNVEIGQFCYIGSHTSIASNVKIGASARIGSGVRIEESVQIGYNFICQPGAVIGSDGFSYVTEEKAGVEVVRETLGQVEQAGEQTWLRIHSLGSVRVGNDVEIGANSAIDRGTIRDTLIGDRTKLDNLVHVGHNVQIGEDCLICGQVGIAGSAKIGNRVVLGGQCGVNDNIFVGDDVIAGGASKIFTNAPKGRVLLGYPAVKMDTHIEMQKALRRLPRFMKNKN